MSTNLDFPSFHFVWLHISWNIPTYWTSYDLHNFKETWVLSFIYNFFDLLGFCVRFWTVLPPAEKVVTKSKMGNNRPLVSAQKMAQFCPVRIYIGRFLGIKCVKFSPEEFSLIFWPSEFSVRFCRYVCKPVTISSLNLWYLEGCTAKVNHVCFTFYVGEINLEFSPSPKFLRSILKFHTHKTKKFKKLLFPTF